MPHYRVEVLNETGAHIIFRDKTRREAEIVYGSTLRLGEIRLVRLDVKNPYRKVIKTRMNERNNNE